MVEMKGQVEQGIKAITQTAGSIYHIGRRLPLKFCILLDCNSLEQILEVEFEL